MRKVFTLIYAFALGLTVGAQVPQSFSYQGVARNSSGQALVNQAIGVQFSMIKTSATGTVEYTETHSATTNAYGLFTLNVGGGTPLTGTFAGIDWSQGPKFLKVEIDPTGGTSYTHIGTTQLLSVPYAQYAGNGDKTVTLTGQGGVQISGTYPNFTVGLPPVQQLLPGGTVRGKIRVVNEFNIDLTSQLGGVTVKLDTFSTVTDSTGWYELTNVPPGEYNVQLSKPGFCAPDYNYVNVLTRGVTYLFNSAQYTLSILPSNTVILDNVTASGGNVQPNYHSSGAGTICGVVYYSKDSASLSYSNYAGSISLGDYEYLSTMKTNLGMPAGGKVYFIAYPRSCGPVIGRDKYNRPLYSCVVLGSPSNIKSVTLP